MGYLTYLKIEGIEGGCEEPAHRGWLELQSFSHSLMSSEGRGGGGQVHQDFAVTKLWDKSSPLLARAVCEGRHFKEVVLELCINDATKPRFMEMRFTNATLLNYSIGGGPSTGPELAPYENFALRMEGVEWRHYVNAFVPGKEKEAEMVRTAWSADRGVEEARGGRG